MTASLRRQFPATTCCPTFPHANGFLPKNIGYFRTTLGCGCLDCEDLFSSSPTFLTQWPTACWADVLA
ncbi:hypothetical protein ATANTOWER_030760 [Ataeniobius toweri]|uniref:Uncharacterized protein n=1 Tax=Ataeniobius toweri TaxID=208326 RepID=A0ABU7C534_9TELE|nr:hypothetical protein [Ataeniobius toweri]